MADSSILLEEIAERRQWLVDMWKLQDQDGTRLDNQSFSLLKSESGKRPIKVVQNTSTLGAAEKLRETFAAEDFEEDMARRLRAFAGENAKAKRHRGAGNGDAKVQLPSKMAGGRPGDPTADMVSSDDSGRSRRT